MSRTLQVINSIRELYEKHGQSNYIGESISQVGHALQTASLLETMVIDDKYRDEVVVAGLLHDIGHLLEADHMYDTLNGDLGVRDHQLIGANYLLEAGFPDNVVLLVSSHVDTKRYLCTIDLEYANKLSDASRKTLFLHQGGLMDDDELNLFERDPLFKYHLFLRRADEAAKETDFVYKKSFDDYLPLMATMIHKVAAIPKIVEVNGESKNLGNILGNIVDDIKLIYVSVNELLDEKRQSPRTKINSKLDASVGNYQLLLQKITVVKNNLDALIDITAENHVYLENILSGQDEVKSMLKRLLNKSSNDTEYNGLIKSPSIIFNLEDIPNIKDIKLDFEGTVKGEGKDK